MFHAKKQSFTQADLKAKPDFHNNLDYDLCKTSLSVTNVTAWFSTFRHTTDSQQAWQHAVQSVTQQAWQHAVQSVTYQTVMPHMEARQADQIMWTGSNAGLVVARMHWLSSSFFDIHLLINKSLKNPVRFLSFSIKNFFCKTFAVEEQPRSQPTGKTPTNVLSQTPSISQTTEHLKYNLTHTFQSACSSRHGTKIVVASD